AIHAAPGVFATQASLEKGKAARGSNHDHDVRLTVREFDLLSYLLAHPGRVHTRDTLLENVWGHEFSGDRKTVDVHIRWLREKFAGVAPFEIVTVRGIGYRLDRQAGDGAA
ncbi:MAG: winged helix-turn-helix domain-containing protein, partial [Candidatus Dormibacteraceae bacterium]